jgi:crotonobetaine/carnitine-CoA ligase
VTGDQLTEFNLARAVVRQAQARPDLLLGTVDDQIRLADALGLAAARAADLLSGALRPGQRVALIAPTSTDYLITWLACLLAGTPVALINPTYPDDLLAKMLVPLSPDLTITADSVPLDRSARPRDWDDLPGLAAGPFDVASFMHTSGTTGPPKFCTQSHEYFRRLGAAMAGALDLQPSDRVLAPLPLFHINPMGYGIITALLAGADALTTRKFSASTFWPTVIQERISVLVLHAPPVEILKRATAHDEARGHHIRTMFYADRDFLHEFGIPAAVSGYGSTEAAGVTHLQRWRATDDIPHDASRHGGPPRDDIQSRVDQDGVIFVRETERATLFDGYVTVEGIDPARDSQGWFDTGDFGRMQQDYLVFLERGAESIRVKGEFVPIPFVEGHFANLPGLIDHAIWKRPGRLVDDEVVLYIVTDGQPMQDLAATVAARAAIDLPAFMKPTAIALVACLPRDAAAGKVQRRLLSSQPVLAWQELA